MTHPLAAAPRSRGAGHSVAGPRPARLLCTLTALIVIFGGRATAQYSLSSPAGQELQVSREVLLQLDDTTRALRANLEEDPRVLYYLSFGDPASSGARGAGYPWDAVEVITDSTVAVVTPGNLREADRAYANYAVLKMQAVRADPDVRCDSVFAREVRAVSGFVDGWLVSRTLYGGPPHDPLDELVFARREGHLAGLVAARSRAGAGSRGCLAVWVRRHPDRLEAYERWRKEEYLGERDAPRPELGAEVRSAAAPGDGWPGEDGASPLQPRPR